jgi:hypothetical protein
MGAYGRRMVRCRQGEIMASSGFISPGQISGNRLRALVALGAVVSSCLVVPQGWGKNPPLTAIELFDGASGPAYLQVAEVLINGKPELRSCAGAESASIEKSAYSKFPKVVMVAGGVLERGQDGVLRYTVPGGQAGCVVPANIKFEHGASFTPAAMADSADLRGRAVAAGSDGSAAPQPIKKGVKLVFVAAPDVDQAEYLLAQRIGNESGWQNYLSKYASSPHTDAAKMALSGLYIDAGEKALSAYQASLASAKPSLADLKNARTQMNLADTVLPNSKGEAELAGGIRASLEALTARAKAELDAYDAALKAAKPGFAHLENAKSLVTSIQQVDPAFGPAKPVQAGVEQAGNAYETAVHAAETSANDKQWEQALKEIQPYRQFAGEQPRVAHVLDSAYSAYLLHGQQLEDAKDWKNAIESFQDALKIKDTAEAHNGLKEAQKELAAMQDQAAANAALEKSKAFELQNDMIPAYEVLAGLPDSQRLLVKDDMTRLMPNYITAASQRAKEIAGAYPNIQGIGDERAVESAYAYLQHAYDLSDVPAAKQDFQTRMQNLGDELATWFLDRAKHSLEKPLGSGTELGWAYLKEAESYKAANLEAVRDQMKLADPAHGMHSKLSIRVQFRDQTSQRQSEGFASQMESAIAAGLDTSGMPVRVVRSGDTFHEGGDPDFLIAGDVLDHHISAPPTVESVESKYVAGVHEVPSEQWNTANRGVDSAAEQLHTAQASLEGAKTRGKKKEIEDAENQVATAQKALDDARVKLDSIARTHTEDIIRPYMYKKTTYDVLNRVVLQFRIDDVYNGQKGEPVQVQEEDRKKFVTLTDVNASDVNGIKAEYTLPDMTELQTELENKARADLIAKVHEKIVELPHKIYDVARQKEKDGYVDDAGEEYMRYLSVAPADEMNEREHAEKFLQDQFNFQVFPGAVKEPQRSTPPLEQGMAQPAE